MNTTDNITKVIIIGGGLAGLTIAVYLARAGYRVTVLEKARAVGGRAQTRSVDRFQFNLGPHALYAAGEATAVLQELGIPFSGSKPALQQTRFARDGRLVRLPLKLGDMVGLLPALWRVMRTDPATVTAVPIRQWLAQAAPAPRVRALLATLVRLATYAHNPHLSAAVFLQQMQKSPRQGVYYLDGGWQALVNGLRRAAETAGVNICTGERVTAVAETETGVVVHAANGTVRTVDAALLAVDPRMAAALLPHHEQMQAMVATAVPVRAALLDVALMRLPRPAHSLVLGLDAPTYLSVHSQAARLAPGDGALIHLAYYLAPGEAGTTVRKTLEALLDLAQPGWQDICKHVRFLPEVTVVSRLATADEGGLNGRVHPQLSRRLYLAGDWVGQEGWLADASLASARRAAQLLTAQFRASHQQLLNLSMVN